MHIDTFKVEDWLSAYENDAEYEMAEVDIKPFKLKELLSIGDFADIEEKLLNIKLGYNPTTGSEILKKILASMYENNTIPEDILVTTGAIEAEFLISNALINQGDTVIVQFPAYQALYSTAKALGAKIKYWKMNFEDGFKPDINELKRLVDKNTKLIALNIPHNPTGAIITKDQLNTILGWAEEQDFYVLCDEVYHELELTKGLIPPYGRSLSKKAISVGSMSKIYGLSGLRIGWLASKKEVVQDCFKWRSYTSISNSPLSDFLAVFSLMNREKIMQRNLTIAKRNLEVLIKWFNQHANYFDCVIPKVGLLCFPKLKNIPVSSVQLSRDIFNEKKLLLVPGEAFDMPGHLRIGFGGDSNNFDTCLSILSNYLKYYYKI